MRAVWVLAAVLFSAPLVHAGPITFDLRADSIEAIDEVVSFTLTDLGSGLTATLTANTGVLNRTKAAFGINAAGVGDDTDTIDGILGAEKITIEFNMAVTFDAMQLSLYTPHIGDQAALKIGSFPALMPVPLAAAIDPYAFTEKNFVGLGETVTLGWARANGFSFDNFTVSIVAAPEPTGGLLAMLGLGALAWRRRRLG